MKNKKTKNKEKNNSTICIAIIVILVLIFSPICTYLIASLFKNNHSFIPAVGTANAWIGFAGSVIGGSMTIIVLYFTVKRAQKEAKSYKKQLIKPSLYCELKNVDDNNRFILEEPQNDYSRIEWKIINTSSNPAYNVKIIEENDYIYDTSNDKWRKIKDDFYTYYGISIFTVRVYESMFVPPNKSQTCYTNFYFEKNEKTYNLWHGKTFMHSIVFEYYDASNENKYVSEFVFEMHILFTVDDDVHYMLANTYTKILE